MKKFLKSTVIIMGIMIILLFIVTVIAITNKYNENTQVSQNIDLEPKLQINEQIKSFYVEKNKLYILIEYANNNTKSIYTYNLNTGKLLNRIELK